MQRFKVSGMTCGHCVRAVTAAIKRVDTGASVDIDLGDGRVTVRDETVQASRIASAISGEGYVVEKLAA